MTLLHTHTRKWAVDRRPGEATSCMTNCSIGACTTVMCVYTTHTQTRCTMCMLTTLHLYRRGVSTHIHTHSDMKYATTLQPVKGASLWNYYQPPVLMITHRGVLCLVCFNCQIMCIFKAFFSWPSFKIIFKFHEVIHRSVTVMNFVSTCKPINQLT